MYAIQPTMQATVVDGKVTRVTVLLEYTGLGRSVECLIWEGGAVEDALTTAQSRVLELRAMLELAANKTLTMPMHWRDWYLTGNLDWEQWPDKVVAR